MTAEIIQLRHGMTAYYISRAELAREREPDDNQQNNENNVSTRKDVPK
jgi:hypothetical protein